VQIADKGWQRALRENAEIRAGANVVQGKIVYRAVADALGLQFTPLDEALHSLEAH